MLAGGAARTAVAFNLPGLVILALALKDLRPGSRALENGIHGLLILASLGVATLTGSEAPLLVSLLWLLAYRMWRRHWMGGGDAKLLMALVGLYPYPSTVVGMALGWLVVGLVWTARLYRRAFLPALFHAMAVAAAPPRITREDLERRGVPMAGGIAVGFAVYLASRLLL